MASTDDDPPRCALTVYDPDERAFRPCKRRAGHGADGKICAQHAAQLTHGWGDPTPTNEDQT